MICIRNYWIIGFETNFVINAHRLAIDLILLCVNLALNIIANGKHQKFEKLTRILYPLLKLEYLDYTSLTLKSKF